MVATLLNDGDEVEKYYWNQFLKDEFPSYEKYWASYIVPMTNRPNDIHFKNSSQLILEGFTPDNVCKAQLHYTIFRHLARAFEIKKVISNMDFLAEGFFHITGAQDVAFEFLQRVKEPNYFDPWAPKQKASLNKQPASKEAMDKWKKNNNFPLQDIRDYRNHLTHGRMMPSIQSSTGKILLPKIGKENKYLDWRLITDRNVSMNQNIVSDFDNLENILLNAWEKTVKYLESEWCNVLQIK